MLLGTALACLAGCGDGGTGGRETRFVGAVAGPTEVGRIDVRFAAGVAELTEEYGDAGTAPAEEVAMTGTLDFPGGRSIALAGSYDRTAQLTYLQGTGYVIAVYLENSSTATGPLLEGYYAGPDGQGRLVAYTEGADTVRVLCGSFTGGAAGEWAVVLGDATAAVAVPADRTARSYLLLGELSGDSAHYREDDYDPAASADAAFSADRHAATGTWTGDGRTGEWSATATGCAEPAA